eukprot:CAMPEP_0197173290 /NCGR_PEP_ID=MMETSP1423-20130617/284_1 /TAXON_ID=476441 /ORGANISM="Pseudo-nitzschia heimii, Strain UNC1101" /LENGTH=81 /DNA_ID=CAMNT_0042622085 /DNA_START=64 /DNA_END=309 /DNA_ORIENTATION=+
MAIFRTTFFLVVVALVTVNNADAADNNNNEIPATAERPQLRGLQTAAAACDAVGYSCKFDSDCCSSTCDTRNGSYAIGICK